MINAGEINTFLERILADGGMEHLEASRRQTMVNYMKRELEDDIFAALLSCLNDRDVAMVEDMVGRGAQGEEIQGFIKKRIPDVSEVVAEVMLNFRNHYVAEG